MLPFMTQPAVAPACYRPAFVDSAALVFERASITRLQRTTVAPTDGRRATLFASLQRTSFGAGPQMVWGTVSAGATLEVYFDVSDRLCGNIGTSGGAVSFVSNRVFRDIGTYHVLVGIDTTQAIASDRIWVEINGVALTFSSVTYPAPWAVPTYLNAAGQTTRIGAGDSSYSSWGAIDAVLSEAIGLDGTALRSVRFLTANIHGELVRKEPELTATEFGANGFRLDFSDPLNPGNDVSGQGNHFTATGFDAAGKDTVASTTTNRYATLNALVLPRYNNERYTLTDGNCRATSTTGGYPAAVPTMMVRTGRWYDETTVEALSGSNDGLWIGLYGEADIAAGYPSAIGNTATSVAYMPGGSKKSADNPTTFGAAWGAGAIIGRAIDCETGGVWFSKDGVWQGGGDPATGVNPAFAFTPGQLVTAGWSDPSNAGNATFSVNFGQRAFAYAPPTGFKALCTDNLPEPDIKDPAEAMVAASAAAGSLVAVLDAMTAEWDDWLEIAKQRDGSQDWALRTTQRPGRVVNWPGDSDGDNAFAGYAAGTWLGRRWRLGAKWGCQVAVVTKTAVGAETFAWPEGWDGRSVGMIWARRIDAGPASLLGYHRSLGASDYIVLSASGVTTAGIAAWGGVAPTDSQFTLGAAFPAGAQVLVVGWAEVAGHSWFGQYSANGAADGPFIPGGVAPELFAVLSNRDVTQDRAWIDAAAGNGVNPCDNSLFLDLAIAESAGQTCDFVVGGVKARASINNINNSTNCYLAAMWGRPIGGICVAPANAR